MSHVVHLEIHGVTETRDIFASVLADLDVGVDVAVGVLGAGDEGDHAVHLAVDGGIGEIANVAAADSSHL